MIVERVTSGLAAAKRNGTRSGNPIGRPKITATKQSSAVTLRRNEALSYRDIGKKLKLGHVTVRNYCRAKGEGVLWQAGDGHEGYS